MPECAVEVSRLQQLAVVPEGRHRGWVRFEGNYGAYIEDLKRRKGADADQPHRIKYKPLVRK